MANTSDDFDAHNKQVNDIETKTNPVNKVSDPYKDLNDAERKDQNDMNKRLGVRENAPESVVPNPEDPQNPVQNVPLPPQDPQEVAEKGVLEAKVGSAQAVKDVKKV